MENKTPDPKTPGGGQNANTMGGPQFHPGLDKAEDKSSGNTKTGNTQILNDDQIPSVTPPES